MPPTGIVLAQLGGPRDQKEVEPFVRAIFADPDLVPIPGIETPAEIEEIVAYAVGHGTIGNAPGVNHTTLADVIDGGEVDASNC